MFVEFILAFTIASFAWYLMTRLPENYPPTPPIRLPILGHAHYLFWIKDTKRTSALYEMFKQYNKNGVLTLHIGTERMTMIGKHLVLQLILLHIYIGSVSYRQVPTGQGTVFKRGDKFKEPSKGCQYNKKE